MYLVYFYIKIMDIQLHNMNKKQTLLKNFMIWKLMNLHIIHLKKI